MKKLLERIRELSRLMQASDVVEYDSIAKLLGELLHANICIVNRNGKVYGRCLVYDLECETVRDAVLKKGWLPEEYNRTLLERRESRTGRSSVDGYCTLTRKERKRCPVGSKMVASIPVYGVGERIGTLLVTRYRDDFEDDDLVLAEAGAMVVGMEMLRGQKQLLEKETRSRAAVQIAVASLSYSEQRAVIAIFDELEGTEDRLIASHIADKAHLTRSVIVNALRKLESAGVIATKSLGMKGTHIKVLNENLIDEINMLNV